jgi:CcmD family protein
MSEWNFVIAAYGLTWFVLSTYVVYLMRRRTQAERALVRETREDGWQQ